MLNQELNDVITKNLPTMVGEQLRERLSLCDRLEKENERLQTKVKDYDLIVSQQNTVKSREDAVTAREKTATDTEQKLQLREALIQLRESHALERVQELRGVVTEVFANNKYKYFESGMASAGMMPGTNGMQPYPMTVPVQKNGTVEG